MKIIVCRHGETNLNVEGKIKGQTEGLQTTFTDEGKYQIQQIAKFIKNNFCEAIFSSDMIRARETAELVVEKLSLPFYILTNFRGLNVGIMQGLSKEEFESSDIPKRAFSDYDFAFPEGESVNQLIHRFLDGLDRIRDFYNFDNVALISHGAAISNVVAHLNHEKFQRTDYCIIESMEQGWSVIDSGSYKNLFN